MLNGFCLSVVVFLALAGVARAQSDAPVPRKLSGEEIRQIVTGGRIEGDNGKFVFTHWFKSDGSLSGESCWSGSGCRERGTDAGTWRVSGDQLCTKFRRWEKDQEVCRDVETAEGGRYRYSGRSFTFSVSK